MVVQPSNWLTAARLARASRGLCVVPGQAPGIPLNNLHQRLWEVCGGPFDEIAEIISLLRSLGLLQDADVTVVRSRVGNHLAKAIRRKEMSVFGLLLVRAGYFHDQARALIETGEMSADGDLRCVRRKATSAAPQLVGVLSWWSEVQVRQALFVPRHIVSELNTVWAMLPPPKIPTFAQERKAVGDRAEMYSVQFERSRSLNPAAIAWVAQDSDEFGWDIEDRASVPVRRIEVKGRRDGELVFFLSENEFKKASAVRQSYQIHFWGEIDLSRHPAVEYASLRASGYPVIINDFLTLVDAGTWVLTPVRWRAELRKPQPPLS